MRAASDTALAMAVLWVGLVVSACSGDENLGAAQPAAEAGADVLPEANLSDVPTEADSPDSDSDADDAAEPEAGPELVLPDIDLDQVESDLDYLTGDELAGRATATSGNELAVAHVESLFASIGLQPAGDEPGSYRQAFPYQKYEQLVPPVVSLDGTALVSGQDFTVFMYSSPGQIDAEVVFVGYGLVVPPFDSNVYPGCPVDPAGFDEYAGVDLAGKIALIVLGAPTDAFANCPFEYAGDRLQSAHARGAGGVITVGGDGYPQQVIRGYLTPDGSEGMPLIAIDRQRLESALPAFASWLSDINTTLTPQSRALGIDGSIAIDAHVVDTVSHNVLGMIPGSDPVIGDEIVIVSGHIDALGVDEQTGAVYAGANDNASGTVAAYRLAEQILAEYGQPKRTLLVAAWNGEETGLRGSCYYAANPVHPLSDTVAVVNIEMLSSGDGSSVLVYGEDDATTGVLFDLLEAGNERLGVPVQAVGLPMYSDSDHWCFYERGIAATSIRGGPYAMAPGYHTPQDNMNNFVMADMHQGMNAVWGLLAPLALGLEVELLTNSTRRLERGFGPPFTSPPLLYSPLGVPPLTSPTITSTPFQ